MCSAFYNNLIYRVVFSTAHPEVNSLKTRYNILLIILPIT